MYTQNGEMTKKSGAVLAMVVGTPGCQHYIHLWKSVRYISYVFKIVRHSDGCDHKYGNSGKRKYYRFVYHDAFCGNAV